MSNIFGASMVPQSAAPGNIVEMLVQTVKQDVEQTEKGKQWPYSSYSLAKDCVSIPGLDDVSPEEIRFEAYQAKANGNVPAFQQKMEEMKSSYASKRQQLVNPSNELKEVYRRIYNKENLSGMSSVFTSGTFSLGASQFGRMGTPSVKNSGSIFGGNTSSSIFGNRGPMTSTASLFGNSGSGLFGSGSQPQQSASIFGGSGSNIFGSSQPQSGFNPASQPSSNFGASPAATSGGIFGQKPVSASPFSGQTGAQPTSLFGQSSGSSIFGTPALGQSATTAFGQSTNSTFGQSQSSASVFGAQNQTSIFGQAANIAGGPFQSSPLFGGQQQPASGIFSGQSQQSSSGPFSQPPQQHTSLFGGQQQPATGIFGGQVQQQQQTSTGIFGGQTQPQAGIFGSQTPQQSSLFGPQTPQQSTGIFGQPQQPKPSGLFGQQHQQTQPQPSSIFGQQQQQPSGIFSSQASQQQQSLFGQPQGTLPAPTTFGSSSSTNFGVGEADSGTPQSNLFANRTGDPTHVGSTPFGSATGGGLFGEVFEQVDSSTYTALEQLGKEILDSFQSGKFELGKIPEMPPPKELCV